MFIQSCLSLWLFDNTTDLGNEYPKPFNVHKTMLSQGTLSTFVIIYVSDFEKIEWDYYHISYIETIQ